MNPGLQLGIPGTGKRRTAFETVPSALAQNPLGRSIGSENLLVTNGLEIDGHDDCWTLQVRSDRLRNMVVSG